MVIQPKKNGRARRTVYLSGLSRAGRHESHHTRSAAEFAPSYQNGMVFSPEKFAFAREVVEFTGFEITM